MLLLQSDILHAYVLYIYNGGVLSWAICSIPIGHMSASDNLLLMFTMADVYTYIHTYIYNNYYT